MTKRQKVGRGLRICVDQNGERVLDNRYNTLTVIANESYKEFASTLQKELETDNFKFGIVEPISFAGISVKQANGKRYELSQAESESIFQYLVDNDYMSKGGKVTQKYYQDVHNQVFVLPDKFETFTEKVVKQINSLSREIEIRDASTKVDVHLNKKVELSPEFKILWDKIKQKTKYSINMDIDRLKRDAAEQIKNMPRIKADQIDGTITEVDINKSGVTMVREQSRQYGAISEFEQMDYPDFVRRLQDATGLLRRTIIEIIVESGRLHDFYVNPEECIKQVSKILLNVKKKKNVSLSPFKDDTFDLLNGSVRGHNGINVILGKRSTGKSYLLNNIYNSFRNEDNVLYIRQFEIANYSSNDQFKKLTDTTNKLEVKNYCQDINDLLLSIHSKDFLDERYDLEQFLSSLNTFADESTMSNAFSKMKLFSYDALTKEKNKQDNEIVQALKTLLDSDEEHKRIIEEKVSIDSIKELFRIFLTRAKESELHNMIIDEANRITKSISKALAKESPIEPIKHVSFSDIYELAYTREKFNELLGHLKTIDITNNVVSEKFQRKVSIFKPSYSNLKDYKRETSLDRIDSFKGDDIFQAFINKSDELLELVAEDELYRFFIGSSSSITTNGSKDLSGGEKAEYILIEKLQYSKKRDIVLIDEMESSFDNLYLNSFINDLLHKISEESTVFISTHNNNLGVSLEPDYYIYHMYEDSDGKDIYKRFYGSQSAEELSTVDGETIKLSDILVETMEASAKAYDERKAKYEISKDK